MGPVELILYLLYRLALYLWRATLKRDRFSKLYNLLSPLPDKNGIIVPSEEFKEEWPRPTHEWSNFGDHQSDSIQIFAQNSKGQILLASIQRQPDGRSIASLYVRLASGRSFCLGQPLQVDSSIEEHFVAGGLRISCVHPMRRWRVSFNGDLKEVAVQNSRQVHVKLVAIGNLAHGCADFHSYYDEAFLARQLAQGAGLRALNREVLQNSLRSLTSYHQRFSFACKVFVENETPEEMFMFGYKTRSSGEGCIVKKSIIAFTENGISSVLGITDLSNIMNDLVFGYINFPTRQQRPLEYASAAKEFFMPGKLAVDIGAESFKSLRLAVLEVADEIQELECFRAEFWERNTKFCKISLDGNVGYALIVTFTSKKVLPSLPEVPRYLKLSRALPSSQAVVLPFEEPACANVSLTGGKGSSLALLTQIALDHSELFRVPQGVCVTTTAYEQFVATEVVAKALAELEKIVASEPSLRELREACDRICPIIASAELPQSISSAVSQNVNRSHRYAVRSSACGEDSEETSAAGQMETILGVEGSQQVLQAIARCWASQFSFIALQYRRRYGQPVNVPMCVVVQEMVASEVSGVMFTVDPVSGNPRHITITANYGLGESVVSAAADPDTFIVAKTEDSREVEFLSEELGEKKLFTVMSDTGGTVDVTGEACSSEACLSREQVLHLAKVALVLERAYAAPRDTEWAYFKDTLYMLQARPVTSLDQIDTHFEYLHESDQGFDSEIDSLSKANCGEVFGGSMSTLGLDVIDKAILTFRIAAQELNGEKQETYAKAMFLLNAYSQCFFPTYWPGLSDYASDDLFSVSLAVSMAGRKIDDECVIISNRNKKRYQFFARLPSNFVYLLTAYWSAEKSLKQTRSSLESYKAQIDMDRFKDSREFFKYIVGELPIFEMAMMSHEKLIMYGSLTNVAMLTLLSYCNNKEWNQDLYADFAKLTASCQESIESTDVPTSMMRLAKQVENQFGEEFKKFSLEEAETKLREDRGEAGCLFRKFIEDHGHRCMRELDIHAKSWSMDATPMMKSIQSMLGLVRTSTEKNKQQTHDELIDTLNIRLPKMYRSLLKLILKRVQKGIALRESGKSLMVMSSDILRKYFYRLGNMMVKEGRIPEEDLIFHLTLSEIHELLETRAPKYLIRARHRRTNQKTAALAIFPEHSAGRPIKCLNAGFDNPLMEMTAGSVIHATPVCAGRAKGPVRVVLSVEDADQIQEGDILVTYATDIGWSPYFPLLAGIITELGGLISHGAVVAREYGIPSVVGAHGATRAFRSGQTILLDGSKGTIGLAADDE